MLDDDDGNGDEQGGHDDDARGGQDVGLGQAVARLKAGRCQPTSAKCNEQVNVAGLTEANGRQHDAVIQCWNLIKAVRARFEKNRDGLT